MIDINLNKVNKSYGFDKILSDINLNINRGEKVSLIGSNGCGKSTLLKIIAGKETINSGEVSIRKGVSVGYLSQIPINIDIKVKDYIYDTFKNLIELKENLISVQSNRSLFLNSEYGMKKVRGQFLLYSIK